MRPSWARGGGGRGLAMPAPQPLGSSALRLTGWHSVSPPSVPRGSQLQPGGEQSGPGRCGAGPHLPAPLPSPSTPSTPPPPHRLTGAALRVPGTQPPEPGFTAIAAGPLHMGPARTGGLCLGEGETEGQDGSLPFYPKPSALEPRPGPISGMSPEWGQRTSQGTKWARRLPRRQSSRGSDRLLEVMG